MEDQFAWLLITVIGLIGVVWTMIQKHSRVTPVLPGRSIVETKAEEQAKKDEQAAVDKRNEVVVAAKADAENEQQQLLKKLESGKDKLLEDNEALTEHLKSVGRDVRGGGV